jgi:sensor histidine kinase YesM
LLVAGCRLLVENDVKFFTTFQGVMKFDKNIWAFIIAASFIIPGFMHLRSTVMDTVQPHVFYLVGILFTFIVTLSISAVNFTIVKRIIDPRLPWTNDRKRITIRIIIEFLITSALAAAIISVIVFIFDSLTPMSMNTPVKQMYFDNITIAIIVNFIAISIIEGYYIFKKWKSSLLQAERLQRENVESQFNALKNQVNPHFLFNSLNVLNSLIAVSAEQAKEFVQEFSKIYRYVFDVGEEMVVELSRELEFIQSYVYLQKKRHGEALRFEVSVNSDVLQYYIPVLALQILVENAVKHNEISIDRPLKISIKNEGDWLVVSNNLQLREKEDTTGIGLSNLRERYKLLTDLEPEFKLMNACYVARVPLLTEDV